MIGKKIYWILPSILIASCGGGSSSSSSNQNGTSNGIGASNTVLLPYVQS